MIQTHFKAMLQWVRRLDCVDRMRLQIGGASAGGYMTLAIGSEVFPLSALVSELPAVNWAYGIEYTREDSKNLDRSEQRGQDSLLRPNLHQRVLTPLIHATTPDDVQTAK